MKSPRARTRPARQSTKTRFLDISDWLTREGNAMIRSKLSRRQFVAATAMSSAALVSAPYIRTAHAAGKLRSASGTTGFPAPTTPPPLSSRNGRRRKKSRSRSTTSPARAGKNDHHHRGGSPGEVRPRHPGHGHLVAARQFRIARADGRHHGADHQENGDVNGTVQISRPGRRQVDGRADLHRQPDQGALLRGSI